MHTLQVASCLPNSVSLAACTQPPCSFARLPERESCTHVRAHASCTDLQKSRTDLWPQLVGGRERGEKLSSSPRLFLPDTGQDPSCPADVELSLLMFRETAELGPVTFETTDTYQHVSARSFVSCSRYVPFPELHLCKFSLPPCESLSITRAQTLPRVPTQDASSVERQGARVMAPILDLLNQSCWYLLSFYTHRRGLRRRATFFSSLAVRTHLGREGETLAWMNTGATDTERIHRCLRATLARLAHQTDPWHCISHFGYLHRAHI